MKEIKILDPLFKAWDDMVTILFKPFSLSVWLILGFTAWLAFLGEGWGGSWNCNFTSPFDNLFKKHKVINSKGCKCCINSLQQSIQIPLNNKQKIDLYFNKIKRMFASTSVVLIVFIALGIIMIAILAAIIMVWIKSRGEFMFIDNLVNKRTEINLPWKEYKNHGNSLFIGQIVISCVIMFVFLVLIGIGGVISYSWIADCMYMRKLLKPSGSVITGVIILAVLFFLFAIFSTVVSFLIKYFVIPLMYFRDMLFYRACLTSLDIFKDNLPGILGYIGVWFVLNIVIATGVLILNLVIGICTCCIGLFILSLPYLWAVFYLPLLTFLRFFSINFVNQFTREPEAVQ